MTIGDEIVYRVQRTAKGTKVERWDGRGLRDGLFAKGEPRYFYGDDADERAHSYAEEAAGGEDARVAGLGVRV